MPDQSFFFYSTSLLIFTQYFTPAKNAGGPITSISNLVAALGQEFPIVSRGQDLNERENLEGIRVDTWTDSKRNYFVGMGFLSLLCYLKLLRSNSKEVFYINGIFDWKINFLPMVTGKKLIISPRGMLQQGALKNGSIKKGFYLAICRYQLKTKDVIWHATDEVEYQDIQIIFGESQKVQIISNIPNYFKQDIIKSPKSTEEIKLVYYSLISQKKQLHIVLKSIEKSSFSISLDIFGPVKDEIYWKECMQIINQSEKLKVNVRYKSTLSMIDLPDVLPKYDYFILPTLGENFGHAIFEALNCYLPVITSSKTPWCFKEDEDFGFILDDEPTDEFWEKLRSISDVEYHNMCLNARKKSEEFYEKIEKEIIPAYKKLFS